MTRSRRKTPIIGMTCAESEAEFKAQENRRARRAVSATLADMAKRDFHDEFGPSVEVEIPDAKAFGNPWAGPKDGKQFLQTPNEKLMRK